MISIKHSGDFKNLDAYFNKLSRAQYFDILNRYGQEGVDALSSATPKDSGDTAKAWSYKISKYKGGAKISWYNSNTNDGVPIAILIQYGHATKDGSFIQGYDFINPAIRPVFEKISSNVWKEVTR